MKRPTGKIRVYRILLVPLAISTASCGFAALSPGKAAKPVVQQQGPGARQQGTHVSREPGHRSGQPTRLASGDPAPAYSGLPSPARHWRLTFDDEFNSPADLSQWSYWSGSSNADGQGTLQWYDPANATVRGGHLIMTADSGHNGHQCWYGPCRYTSVAMNTRLHFTQDRGIFEARMRVPVEQGIWPAFWMVSGRHSKPRWSAGEIDILEVNGRTAPNLAAGYGHTDKVFAQSECLLDTPLYDAYHVYAIEWTTTGITWMVDGKSCGHMDAYRGWPFNYPFYMLLTLAVGGKWPGPPGASTQFPVRMFVDWVRVYRHV